MSSTSTDDGSSTHDTGQPSSTIIDDFLCTKYVAYSEYNNVGLSPAHVEDGIELLYDLRKTKAALGRYEQIMKWHLACIERGRDSNILVGKEQVISRDAMYKFLFKRYNSMVNKYNVIKEITL